MIKVTYSDNKTESIKGTNFGWDERGWLWIGDSIITITKLLRPDNINRIEKEN